MREPGLLGPEEEIRAAQKHDEWFDSLSPLQQATRLLTERICALNKGVTGALVGLGYTDTLRIVAEDLKLHTERFLTALEEEETRSRRRIRL